MTTRVAAPSSSLEALPFLQRQNTQLRRAVEELAVLNELAVEIASTHDLDVIMRRIVQRALNVARAEQGVITIIDAASPDGALRTLVRTRDSRTRTDALHPPEAILGWMQLHRKSVSIETRIPDERFRAVRWPESVRTVLLVPLLVRGRLTGMITLYNKAGDEVFSDDDRRLLSIIAAQSAQVIENARLLEEEKSHLRTREELRLARRMQLGLLPGEAPAIPGFDVAGVSIPAQAVGGDYFDYVPLVDGRWVVAVGDVVGKGFPAALLMASLQATLRAHLSDSVPDAAECLQRVNRQLFNTTLPGTFVSLVLAFIDPATGSVEYANAGHNRPLILRGNGEIECLDRGGLVLGVRPQFDYEIGRTRVDAGDVLLMYSDGVTEAMNSRREEYDEARLCDVLRRYGDVSAGSLLQEIVGAVERHVDGSDPSDDVTMVVARRTMETGSESGLHDLQHEPTVK
jgi:phosphoserine phosphatase RsbU/P